jgi:ubiquinone/menaquinone biosynthesis C-methylase UbiE
MTGKEGYIPALGFDWLTPLYDPVLKWLFRESRFKGRLVEQAQIQPHHRVLDLGCGTGTLTILIKQAHPEAEVVGLDVDARVLAIAQVKATKAKADITLQRGTAYRLPYPDCSFDRVLSSLVFHHLNAENKQWALREVFRVLRPGGELHVVDFGKPHNVPTFLISLIVRWFEEVADNIQGLLPGMFRHAGFDPVEETARYTTIAGTLSLYRACKPVDPWKKEAEQCPS